MGYMCMYVCAKKYKTYQWRRQIIPHYENIFISLDTLQLNTHPEYQVIFFLSLQQQTLNSSIRKMQSIYLNIQLNVMNLQPCSTPTLLTHTKHQQSSYSC